jgi:hypothetical protein
MPEVSRYSVKSFLMVPSQSFKKSAWSSGSPPVRLSTGLERPLAARREQISVRSAAATDWDASHAPGNGKISERGRRSALPGMSVQLGYRRIRNGDHIPGNEQRCAALLHGALLPNRDEHFIKVGAKHAAIIPDNLQVDK